MCLSVRLSVCDRQSVRAKYRSRLSMTVIRESQISRSWNSGPESQVLKTKCSNRRRESRLLIGLAWLLKLEIMMDVDTATQGFMGRNQEGIRLQIFRFFGGWVLAWRVEWGFGLWFFRLLLYPTINSCNPFNYGLSIYGNFKTIQVKEKKKAGTGRLCPTVMGTH